MLGTIRQVILQPTSACNLNCGYCYVPNRRDSARMNDEVTEAAISKVLRSDLVGPQVEFLWHAGEPLMAGLPYYRRAMETIDRHNTRGVHVTRSLQTNGTLIDPAWCEFLSEHRFSVGLSVDGPEFLHDRQRKNWGGRGSHDLVMRGHGLLKRYGIRHGAICVLTRESLRHPDELFAFFLDNGFSSVAFNVEEVENDNTTSSLTGSEGDRAIESEYRRFMDRVYDLWQHNLDRISIREFDNLARVIAGKLRDRSYQRRPWETEPLSIITIQKNGDISTYSPEFAGARSVEYGDFVIGNVLALEELTDILGSPALSRIARQVAAGISACARECLFFDLCGGAYTSNKFFENKALASTETTACRLHRQTLSSLLIEKLSVSA
ncbi:cyclophane-forming radical SAM/SPASM peptide maturase GrrM/OscB [Microbispora sp. NPDC049125]|uniref:cyclophane-forming radical SAM/SPASM peptide maturase GrrM/OscB n=1 Tax=Microbispora sp. NPDC049125 TaxID=3154929 RepID=UPI003465CF34